MITQTNIDGFIVDILTVKNAVNGLKYGNVYVIDKRTDIFVDAVKTAVNNFKMMARNERFLYSYDVCVIDDINEMEVPCAFYETLQKDVNFIVPLCVPNVMGKQYLMANVEISSLDMFIPSMVMKIENMTKEAIEDALINLAVQETETCEDILKRIDTKVVSDDKSDSGSFVEKLLEGAFDFLGHFIGGSMPMATLMFPSTTSNQTTFSDISYQQSREIISRFPDNCRIIKKSKTMEKFPEKFEKQLLKAKNEMNYVFNIVWGLDKNFNGFRDFFIEQSDQRIMRSFENYIDREKIAEKSKITVLIERSQDGVDKLRKNDGKFRVYIKKGEQKKHIHFGRKVSCVVYMIYLLDKQKRGEDVDTINMANNEKLFCDIYSMVYNVAEGEPQSVFNKVIKNHKGENQQKSIKYCYQTIRDDVGRAIEEFGEVALPFIIPNEKSHISVLKKNIIIPNEFSSAQVV